MNIHMAAADPEFPPQKKYDVFLSFRGEDTRHTFTSHLYAALDRKKIYTYIDERLERGDEIRPALFTAIEQSKLSVIIFSKNYASSSWCLDELLHILNCKKRNKQIVIPVFYDIDPSHVRKQQRTFANAFAILEKRFKQMDKVGKWRDALTTAANLSGFASQDIRTESKLIERIVNDVARKLSPKSSIDLKGRVGIERHIQQIESLLSTHAHDVHFRTIGIWGMGGIGKTTIANDVFHRLSAQFDACSFVANVRDQTEKHGIHHLRDELLRELLNDESLSIGSPSIGSTFVIDRLSHTKVLVVLDDVSELRQLEFLHGNQIQFRRGSRIIITTRNRGLLDKRVHDDHKYKVTELSSDEALQLFNFHAFEDDSFRADYSDLSKRVVDYAQGIPLALKVLGSIFLRCNNREEWEEELKTLKRFPNQEIQDALRLSYNRLEENEQGIFLDIACFLKGEKICDAKRRLEMHGFYASRGIARLIDMSLISISVDDYLEMHDLLQEMGWSIVREQCIEEPGKRSRLWNAEDAYRVLKNNTGTARIEAISLDKSRIPAELQLNRATFKNMHSLKILKFYVPEKVHVEEKQPISFPLLHGAKAVRSFLAESKICSFLRLPELYNSFCGYIGMENFDNMDDEYLNKSCSKMDLPKGLESLPEDLRYLYWDEYPLKSLPSKFCPRNLVELHMPHSQVEKLWHNGQKNLGNLKKIDLSNCKRLTEVPDLSQSPILETIDLCYCKSLVEVPSYFKTLDKLTRLNLGGCSKLKTFPDDIACNVEFLRLSGTAIQEIPPSIWCHEKLDVLGLSCCKDLKNLTSTSWKLNLYGGDQNRIGPRELHLFECKNLESVPERIYNLNRLERLNLIGCAKITRLPPFSVGNLCSLTSIDLSGCCNLLEVSDGLIGLSSLQDIRLGGTMIESIPASIKNASGLRKLYLNNCYKLQSLPELPSLVRILEADNCTSLKTVARRSRTALMPQRWDHQDVGALNHYPQERLMFTNCFQLDKSSRSNIMGDALLRIMQMSSLLYDRADTNIEEFTVTLPGNEIPKWFIYQTEGCNIDVKFPPHWFDAANFLGFTVSAVFELHNFDDDGFSLTCKCSFKTSRHGEGYEYRYELPWVRSEIAAESVNNSDQVLVLFNKDTFWREGNRWASTPIPLNKVTEASFHFYPEAIPYESLVDKLKVSKCGIQMMYTHDTLLDNFHHPASLPLPTE